jgi:2-polyprenyl-3-methyl-5-hydroxy-6-metoxy-1,4-benzoquinol methylase
MPVCLVCGGNSFLVIANAQRLRDECRLRERFVEGRLTRHANPDELKDLTDFFHTEKADLLACERCGLLVRDLHEPPAAQEYSEDEYGEGVMEHQYPHYVEAFRKKENPFRGLLSRGARVLEVGSHYGAFLQVASEWGWQAEGVDPGKDTSRFAKSKGFTVHVATLEDCRFRDEQFDAVFIWNCFEQIEDPRPTLAASRRILKMHGLLTVRTPDGQFYAMCERLLQNANVTAESKEFVLRAMGYNNLLAFPYRYGHGRDTLRRLIAPYGFRFCGALSSELLTFPLPENPNWVEQEERQISSELKLLAKSVLRDRSGSSTGPWVETWFRAV